MEARSGRHEEGLEVMLDERIKRCLRGTEGPGNLGSEHAVRTRTPGAVRPLCCLELFDWTAGKSKDSLPHRPVARTSVSIGDSD